MRLRVLIFVSVLMSVAGTATYESTVAAQGRNDGRGVRPVSRLANGQPDLEGVWSFATLTPLERPKEFAGKPILTEQEAAEFERQTLQIQNRDRRDGVADGARGSDGRTDVERAYNQFWWEYGSKVVSTRQSSLIVDPPDGLIPPLTPEAQQRAAALAAVRNRLPERPEDRSLGERCIHIAMAGPPMIPGPYNNNVQIIQTDGLVALRNEMIHDVRLVPLDDSPHLHASLPQLLGDSRGRWEGATLVVETTNFTDKTAFRGSTHRLRVVERFTRTGPDALLYEFTVTDPSTWTRPWTVSLPMTKSADPIYEYACHEGNYGLANILAAARAEERAAGGR